MKSKVKREISRNEPHDIPNKLPKDSIYLFTAFGCNLFERDTGKTYIYTAHNIKTGKREVISRQPSALTTSGVEKMAEKIRASKVADPGQYEADRLYGNGIALENCRDMQDLVFKEVLPTFGYNIRREQISLSRHILDAIHQRIISLAEAEVGTGKTLAYLVPAIFAKRGRLNGYCNMSFHTGAKHIDLIDMPIVIATSSIALQKAIVTDYIPELSRILVESGFIKTPISVALRKGREHYICTHKLRTHVQFEKNLRMKKILSNLLLKDSTIDLAEIDGLTAYVKRRICVPTKCTKNCPQKEHCPYLLFRGQVQSQNIDIQVCNHNYLLADVMRRSENKSPLIPSYQMIIIDEAHKFTQAARSMYGFELSSKCIPELIKVISDLKFKYKGAAEFAAPALKKLRSENKELYDRLLGSGTTSIEDTEGEAERFSVVFNKSITRKVRNIRNIAYDLIGLLGSEPLVGKSEGRKEHILTELERLLDHANAFYSHDEMICWVEKDRNENRLCAIPKDIEKRLYDDLWSKGIPTILTSGTLSAAGDFSRLKSSLGLNRVGSYRITETSKSSPFNYRENALIYTCDDIPFPNQQNHDYISALANRIESLITVSNGHAAVLFTSYKVMDKVWEILAGRKMPFPMFQLRKGSIREIEKFKKSGNGVLFAAGALWEGIDIPGDPLSMLIIAKLPFPVPDPISEYERTLFDTPEDFKNGYIIPETAIKLKQGAGRGHRTEKDTCVIAICDCRFAIGGSYHNRLLKVLPECNVTDDLGEVESWLESVKPTEFFM